MKSIALCASMALLTGGLAAEADFYVAPGGFDENNGTQSQPFSTLERVREAVREVKRGEKVSTGGITVWLRGGDYARNGSLEFTAADSGTAEAPVTWRAWR